MDCSSLYVKKPVSNSSLVEEIRLMVDIVKPSQKVLVMGLARHIVVDKKGRLLLDDLLSYLKNAFQEDEFLAVDEEELFRWIRDDSYINIVRTITRVSEPIDEVTFTEGTTEDNIFYLTRMNLWSNYTSSSK